MKEILWIRHAQSIGNAGMPTENRSSFPLSAVGYEQAEALAKKIPFTPDLIVSSPFRRAWETAAPTSARYPAVKMEIWPEIHEFTYQRRAAARASKRIGPPLTRTTATAATPRLSATSWDARSLPSSICPTAGNSILSSFPMSSSSNASSSPCAPPI